jgi:palmitoyltransferase
MDHHCPWVGNCVGILNHKYFWNFLLWAFLGTLQVSIVLVSHRGFDHIGEDFFYLIASVMSFAFSLSIGALLAVHTYMIAQNLSTIES